jgi:CRISPR-associated protein Csb1
MTDEAKVLTFDDLKQAVAGHAAAFRCVTEYQPAGGPGDKVFPPTYEGGKYAIETRYIDGAPVPCVLLDSVQSQANRMELALLDAVRATPKRISLPLVEAKFEDEKLLKKFTVTSLEAPHRIADAIFRDSLIEENGRSVMFRKSEKGKILDNADVRNATGLFGLCPTALVFGIWDSTGPRGGLGAKIQRAIVSEIVGFHAQPGNKTSSRIDPLQIKLGAGPVLDRAVKDDRSPDWSISLETTTEKAAKKKEGKRPSEINHGNVTPTITDGGFTISKAVQTTVLSLAAIRRLRFPIPEKVDVDLKARTVIAALGLLGAVLTREEGADLRSRCQLVSTQEFFWELLATPGQAPLKYKLDAATAVSLFNKAFAEAKTTPKLPWEDTIALTPHPDLIELVKRSQELEASSVAEEGQ